MKPQDVFAFYGGKADTARHLGISYQAVHKWELADQIPIGRQFEIEIRSGGVLKSAGGLTKAAALDNSPIMKSA
jgi:hypothetical protein